MDHIPLTLLENSLVCTMCADSASLPFAVFAVLDHYRDHHSELHLTRQDVTAALTNLGLSLLKKVQDSVFCEPCRKFIAKPTAASVCDHLRKTHDIRLLASRSEVADFLAVSEPLSLQAPGSNDRILSLACPASNCDYAIPISAQEGRAAANKTMLIHLNKKHGASAFDDSMTLKQRAECLLPTEAVYRGKRMKKDPNTVVVQSDDHSIGDGVTASTALKPDRFYVTSPCRRPAPTPRPWDFVGPHDEASYRLPCACRII